MSCGSRSRSRCSIIAAGFLIALVLGDATYGGAAIRASIWLWGVVVRTVIVWHITWSVNSLAHVFGYQNYDTGDHSRNNVLVAILASGEGWHNNHHSEPSCACNQRHWWEIDLTYLLLRLFVAVRIGLGRPDADALAWSLTASLLFRREPSAGDSTLRH